MALSMLIVIQMEVDREESKPTGRFRRKRFNPIFKPVGQWPEHWHGLIAYTKPTDITSIKDRKTEGEKCF